MFGTKRAGNDSKRGAAAVHSGPITGVGNAGSSTVSEDAAVLFANEAFYVAFDNRDLQAMETLWARRASVTCIHPGWRALAGREDVMERWGTILKSAHAPRISCHSALARVHGDVAYVICYEAVDNTFLIATNVFVLEEGSWKMVHHQAGASPSPPESDEPANPMERVQ